MKEVTESNEGVIEAKKSQKSDFWTILQLKFFWFWNTM